MLCVLFCPFNDAGNGHIELVKLFLSIGEDVDLRSDVETLFICVVDHSQEYAIKVLVEHHANFDAQIGDDNMCPLLAVAAVDSFCCLKAGDTVNVKDGYMPIHIAATSDNRESTEVLLSVTPQIQSVRERTVDGVIAFNEILKFKRKVYSYFSFGCLVGFFSSLPDAKSL
ncbi:hypothetical protein KY289_036981 [Solanum tuberosum]|nr:hypothetical protein KY289_036981 [Solanum tuberosum]